MKSENWQHREVVCIGLGGISEGYLYPLLLLHQTGVVPFSSLWLVDGKSFRAGNRGRQHFSREESKAAHRCELLLRLFPRAPLYAKATYVDQTNVREIIEDGAIVLLSPDNHATRKIVSDHAETLDNILLISGGNDGINPAAGEDGWEGTIIVHWRMRGKNVTAPITKYHEEIRQPADRLPTAMGCLEQIEAGEPQILGTNLAVGSGMIELFQRYVLLDPEVATKVVELWIHRVDGTWVSYSLSERYP